MVYYCLLLVCSETRSHGWHTTHNPKDDLELDLSVSTSQVSRLQACVTMCSVPGMCLDYCYLSQCGVCVMILTFLLPNDVFVYYMFICFEEMAIQNSPPPWCSETASCCIELTM